MVAGAGWSVLKASAGKQKDVEPAVIVEINKGAAAAKGFENVFFAVALTVNSNASQAGLRSITIYGQSDRKEYILETLGCGCAFIDFDNDGWLDVFLLSGTRLKDAPPGASNHLFKNNRDGTFTDVTERAGLVKIGWACGVCVGDYNNDGFDDLFVTYWGQNVLYRNNGDGTFTDVTHAAGLTQPAGRW